MIIKQGKKEITENVNRLVREVEIESFYWKKLTVGVVGFFSALTFSFLLFQFIGKNSGGNFWLMLGSLVVLVLVLLLQVILINEWRTIAIIIALETIALWSVFIWRIWLAGIVGFIVTGLLMLGASYYGWQEVNDRIKLRFFRAGRIVLSKSMTALAVFIALAYIMVSASGSTSIVSKDFFNKLLTGSSSWVAKFYPGFSFEESLQDNVKLIAEKQINNNSELSGLSLEQKNLFINKSVIEYEKSVSGLFGVSINVRDKLSDSLFTVITFKMSQLFDIYGVVAYLILILIVALVLKGFAPIIYWPAMVVGYFIYEILISIGFAHLVYENRSKEVVVMK